MIESGPISSPEVKEPRPNVFADPSLQLLIVANIVTIYFAVTENWSLTPLMVVYWAQSLIIGFFNFIRILQLKHFTAEGMMINGRPARDTRGVQVFIAFFFLMHYGGFHLGYLLFMVFGFFQPAGAALPAAASVSAVLLTILLFLINHAFSFFYNRREDETHFRNLGSLMARPYIRIIPMHLTIIFGAILVAAGFSALPIILFLVLKTFADILMHIFEHKEKSGGLPWVAKSAAAERQEPI